MVGKKLFQRKTYEMLVDVNYVNSSNAINGHNLIEDHAVSYLCYFYLS